MDNKLISMLFAGMLLAPPQTLHAQYRSEVWHPDNGNGTYTNPVLYADYSDPTWWLWATTSISRQARSTVFRGCPYFTARTSSTGKS